MSNKVRKSEKKIKNRKQSEKKRRNRNIAYIAMGLIALAIDIAMGRNALDNYRNNNSLQVDKIGEIASLAPCILLAFIIVLTVMILLKQNKKK